MQAMVQAVLASFWLWAAGSVAAEELKPFVLASNAAGDFTNTISEVRSVLEGGGFAVAGEYSPFEGAHVIVVTDTFLRRLAGREPGGAYFAPQRVAISREDGNVQVAYTNPRYFANAYRIEADVTQVEERLKAALGREKEFGADGLSPSKLRRYHYSFGMEYFDEPVSLVEYDDHREAVRAIERALDEREGGAIPVYRIDALGAEVTVFGVGMTEGYSADEKIMSIIDVGDLRSTPHLPYEMVVRGGEVEILAPRFRIAISFPDQKMFGEHSFMKIMSSPKAIEKALTQAAGGTWQEDTGSRGGFSF